MRIRPLVLALCIGTFSANLLGQGLQIDPTFGTDGLVRIHEPASSICLYPGRVVSLANGDLLLLARAHNLNANPAVALFRFDSNGAADTDFGEAGVFVTDHPELYLRAIGVAELPDGRLLLSASGSTASNEGRILLMRLTADGVLDPSFGDAGTVVHNLDSAPIGYTGVMRPDGKLVVSGNTYTGLHAFQYTAEGDLDTSFGTNGEVTGDPSPEVSIYPRHVALDPAGNVYIGGAKIASGGSTGWVIHKLDPHGVPVTSFGTDGFVVFDHVPDVQGVMSNNYESIERLYIDASGNVYAAGAVALDPVKERFAFAKFNSSGMLDTSFGTGGILYAMPDESERALVDDLVVDPMGTLIAAGHNQSFVAFPHLLLLRFDMDGHVLGEPGTDGFTHYEDPIGDVTALAKVTQDHTGRIILASGFYNQALAKGALTALRPSIVTGVPNATSAAPAPLAVYPNPASTDVTVTYDLARAGTVTLDLLDATGRSVERLVTRNAASAGRYVEHLSVGNNLASGQYRLSLTSSAGRSSMNIELIR